MKHPAMIIPDALAEAMTRLSSGAGPAPGEVWDEAARHYDERGPAALMLMIATTNVCHRLNVTVRPPAGARG